MNQLNQAAFSSNNGLEKVFTAPLYKVYKVPYIIIYNFLYNKVSVAINNCELSDWGIDLGLIYYARKGRRILMKNIQHH